VSSVRGLLHLNRLDAFAEWAKTLGWQREPTKGFYEVLRLRHPRVRVPIVLYSRGEPTSHVTVPFEGPALSLINRFMKEAKHKNKAAGATPRPLSQEKPDERIAE